MMIKHLSVVALIASLFTLANSENWAVQVGANGKNAFTPATFDANVGDTVTFNFVGGTHDVVQSDAFGKCVKSALANAFNTPVNTGNAAAPPTAVWNLAAAGPLYYYCTVADHCATDQMYATINVLDAGATLTNPGVKAPAAAAAAQPPAQPAAPADDLPNDTPKITTSYSSAASPTASASGAPSAPAKSASAVGAEKHISIAVLCVTLLSLTSYFL
ncbi:hypothetical protein RclHR1_01920018 [Rhizophagus clarus]|uniref:Extracellular serine-rich protein n=1 Tax=Rhizophagus clarus TaxID=94130 RepID=A0A2Z6R2G9_9GLOM|nr:hypothetical protein RclHR1_01920018 [Rhizophagus clarus]GES84053.1 extracellular serine-rich protein [Rhizophagus clarus]